MPKRSVHDRAVRGYQEYNQWLTFCQYLDTHPSVPELMRYLSSQEIHILMLVGNTDRHRRAIEILIKDRYPGFAVMERLKGK